MPKPLFSTLRRAVRAGLSVTELGPTPSILQLTYYASYIDCLAGLPGEQPRIYRLSKDSVQNGWMEIPLTNYLAGSMTGA